MMASSAASKDAVMEPYIAMWRRAEIVTQSKSPAASGCRTRMRMPSMASRMVCSPCRCHREDGRAQKHLLHKCSMQQNMQSAE